MDLNGMTATTFLENLRVNFKVGKTTRAAEIEKGTFHMYLSGGWSVLTPLAMPQDVPIKDRLDVSILQNQLLQPILGIGDPRTEPRIGFVGGIRGMESLEKHVDSGHAAVAFALHAVTIDQLMEVSDAGLIMPPKSTWFEPKLRDGLICHCF